MILNVRKRFGPTLSGMNIRAVCQMKGAIEMKDHALISAIRVPLGQLMAELFKRYHGWIIGAEF